MDMKKRDRGAFFLREGANSMDALKELLNTNIQGLPLEKILGAAVVALVGLLIVKILLSCVDRVLARVNLERPLEKLLRTGLKALLLLLLVITVLGYLDLPISALVAGLSVVGVAVTLGVQNFLTNVAGGMQLLASHPFQIGDYVEAGGCAGTVQEVGLFYTKILTPDHKLIQLPNSSIVAANIINYTREPTRRVEITASVSYDAPVEKVMDCLVRLGRAHPKAAEDPAPVAHVKGYGASAIEYVLWVWCDNGDYWPMYYDLMEGLKPALDREGIEMTYDHLNVHLLEGRQEADPPEPS